MTQNSIDNNAVLLSAWLEKDIADDISTLTNEKELIKQAEKRVLSLFAKASKRVPAYQDFLKKHAINPVLIKTVADYKKIPITTKENYIDKYKFKERCWDGNLETMHMISTSSGTTGKPHFWPRNFKNEVEGAYIHELLFRYLFTIDKQKTLFINGFALGNWIAGTFTSACVNLIALKGYPLTMMSPGYNAEAIIEILEEVACEYKQVILSGHVPFLKEIAEMAAKKKIFTNIKLLGTGQGITENWREYVLKTLGVKSDSISVINLYGSADSALMGFETPFSISLRRLFYNDLGLNKRFFREDRIPSLYNYDPRFTYFEAEKNELCITKNLGCPLFRYNIHDEGGIVSYAEMSKNGDISEDQWQLPFVYLFGRDKFMVKIYGANVYSEHVEHALNHERLQSLLSGRNILQLEFDEDQNPQMICRIELNPDISATPELIKLIEEIFVEEIRRLNSEYKDMLNRMGDKGKPKIILHEHGHPQYFPKGKIKKTG